MANLLIHRTPADDVQPVLALLGQVLDFYKINPDHMIEPVGSRNGRRPSGLRRLMSIASFTSEVMSDPCCDLRLDVSSSEQPSKIHVARMATVFVGYLEVPELLWCWLKLRWSWFFVVTVVEWFRVWVVFVLLC